ncbi:MAG: calcium-binding protein, partial [Pseudomonadota bacterium]
MTQFITASAGGSGVQIALAPDEDALLANDVQIFSDDDHALTAQGGADIVLGDRSALIAFGADAVRLDGDGPSTLAIGEGARILAEAANGIRAEAQATVVNHGAVIGVQHGIQFLEAAVLQNFGTITAFTSRDLDLDGTAVEANAGLDLVNHGEIVGLAGVSVRDVALTLTNHGVISGGSSALSFLNALGGAGVSTIINTGELVGRDRAFFTDTSAMTIFNSGRIASFNDTRSTIDHNAASRGQTFKLFNSGSLESEGIAYEGDIGVDIVRNTGVILGDVTLERLDDVYIGRLGRIEGLVDGGEGDDLIVGGAGDNRILGGDDDDILRGLGGADEIDGDDGADLLDGGGGDDILSGGLGADRLRGRSGADEIAGDDGADALFGNGGADALFGGAGGDDIRGHAGDDVIGGGRGADLIVGGRGD